MSTLNRVRLLGRDNHAFSSAFDSVHKCNYHGYTLSSQDGLL
ncbi:hypothetical protein [Paraburkholderia caledonica]|nr:hypothetical protein [Paraburkholderia caledonica]